MPYKVESVLFFVFCFFRPIDVARCSTTIVPSTPGGGGIIHETDLDARCLA